MNDIAMPQPLVETQDSAPPRQVDELALSPELFSTISHELRTPLAAVKGFAQGLLMHWDQLPEAKQRQFVEHILRATLRLERLVADLSLAGRLAEGVAAEPGRCQLAPTVTQALDEVRSLHPARSFLVNSRSEPVLSADMHRLQQVLVNLLDNAAKYSPAGEPVSVGWYDAGSMIRVEITDRGTGLSLEEQALLFRRFGRLVRLQDGRMPSGSGLGLAICKGLIEAMGGAIGVEATCRGNGNTFWFTLPAATSV